MERLPRLQHDAHGGQLGVRAAVQASTARNGTSSRPTTPSATRCSRRLRANLKKLGGTITGNDLTPLGTTDFSAYLIKARAANPDVLIVLPQGSDMVNCLKQIVQFGIDKQIHVAGLQQELESLEACRPRRASASGCSNGTGTSRACRTSTSSSPTSASAAGKVPTARTWFGYTSVQTSRWSPTRRRRSTRSSSPRRSAISNCRRKSSCSRTRSIIAKATIS